MSETIPDAGERRPLSAEQRARMVKIRDARRAFIAMLHEIGGTSPEGGRMAGANLTLAMRHIEDAEDRALRWVRGMRD